MHEALLAELRLSEVCQGPMRDGGRRTDNSEVTVVKAITLIDPAVRGRHDEFQRHGSFEYIFEQSGS